MKPLYIALPLSILLILLLVGVWAGPLWVADITMPARQAISGWTRSVSGFSGWLEDVETLRRDRQELTSERNELLAEVAKLQQAERENEAIKKQFNLSTSDTKQYIMAQTAGLTQQGGTTYLLINKGKGDGVEEDKVVVSDGVLVGKIDTVGQHSATVQLLTSLGTSVPVAIRQEQSITKGIVEGSFNLTAKLIQVLATDKLTEGDTIETSAEGGLYPPGIVVGKVGPISKTDNQAYQTAPVVLLWDATMLEVVFVEQ